jgi:hypothetical protein
MTRYWIRTVSTLVVLVCAGCLSVKAPEEIRFDAEPRQADCGAPPETYEEALAAWRQLCNRNAWLEDHNAQLEQRYQREKQRRRKAEDRYDRLRDRNTD